MKSAMVTIALLFMAGQAFGQQSGTTTKCTKELDELVCKTTETPPNLVDKLFPKRTPEPKAAAATPSSPSQISPEAVKELLAEQRKAQDAKDTVDYIYCRQNPKGGITDSEGKPKACADIIEYTKAFCSVNPVVERCMLARSREEVQKAFAALINQYNADPHRSKPWEQSYYSESFAKLTKWGCMSFPDMVLPQKEGTHACPNAPETAPLQ